MSHLLNKQTAASKRRAAKYGLATNDELHWGPLRYRWDLIERDTKVLLNRRSKVPVGARGTIPDNFVNYMAVIYLACCRAEGVPVPESLLHLIAQQLRTASFGIRAMRKAAAFEAAARILDLEPDISTRALAKRVGLDPKAVRNAIDLGTLRREGGLKK